MTPAHVYSKHVAGNAPPKRHPIKIGSSLGGTSAKKSPNKNTIETSFPAQGQES